MKFLWLMIDIMFSCMLTGFWCMLIATCFGLVIPFTYGVGIWLSISLIKFLILPNRKRNKSEISTQPTAEEGEQK